MKTIISDYSFNPSAKTITLHSLASIDLERLLMITDISAGRIIYLMNNASLGGTVSGSIITLTHDTTDLNTGDTLQIFYEEPQLKVVQGDLSDTIDSVSTRGKHAVFSGLSATSQTDLLPPTDIADYAQIIIHLTSIPGGNFVQFAFSNDMSTWSAYMTVGAASTYVLPRRGRFLKVSVTTYASGTITGNVALFASDSPVGTAKTAYPVPDYGTFTLMQDNAGNATALHSLASVGDNASGNKPLAVGMVGHDGANSTRLRYANVFKSSGTSTSGDTTVWTPAANRRYRLLGFQVYVSANAAQSSAGLLTVRLRDGTATDIATFEPFVPATAATTLGQGWTSGWIAVGPSGGLGFLSGSLNRVLNLHLSTALTAGRVSVFVLGTEEQ